MDRHLRRATPHAVRRQAIRRKTRHCHPRFYERCSHWSFHAEAPASAFRWTRERWVLGGGALLLTLLTALGIPAWASVIRHDATHPVTRETLALKLPAAPVATAHKATTSVAWKTIEVQPGQTLSSIFHGQGLSSADLAGVLATSKDTGALTTVHPGEKFDFRIDAQGHLEGFRYHTNAATLVTLTASTEGLQSQVTELPVERRIQFAHGVVEGSLFVAGGKAGLPEAVMLKLAHVFRHRVDFTRDVRKGDQFTVIYDDIYRDGAFVRAGDVLAAEFTNKGKQYTAYRFTKPDGSVAYYNATGRPLMMALLRTPVAFTRISSRFGMRMDPIIHKYRLHAGVDYAAPTGTPIHAAGSGVITKRHRERGFGNMIAIRNTPKFTTEYGHMSRFAPGLHVGSHVHQGEVIGYVGQTGWATGPHLHYEILRNGTPVNPLKVTMPKPQPLSPKLMADFKAQTAPLIARIHLINNATQRLAKVDTGRNHTISTD
ncbi:MAG: peptidoglycan DD-metalloendopeptidase family protein [Rhodanobacteraceae bacterium]